MSNTCFLMYLIKASEDQRPMSMIVYTVVPERYMPIAPPDLFEWVPSSSAVKPKLSFPSAFTAARIFPKMTVEEMVDSLPSNTTVFICLRRVFGLVAQCRLKLGT